MSLDPPRSDHPADTAEDDPRLVDGLERALAQARTKIPDHDRSGAADVALASLNDSFQASEAKAAADLTVDTSAVMNVLRGAIDRYTNGDGHEQGTWDDEHPRAATNGTATAEARHLAAGYEPDRRRLAAVVVVLFFLVAGFGYQRFGSGGGEKVKTNTVPTAQGQAVTTLARPSTSAGALPLPIEAPPDTAAPAGSVQHAPAPTVRQPGSTAPPSTNPPVTNPPPTNPPPTTAPPTTAPPTTAPTTTAPTTTAPTTTTGTTLLPN